MPWVLVTFHTPAPLLENLERFEGRGQERWPS